MSVGENLKRHRKRLSMTQREVADKAGLAANHVGLIEQGCVHMPKGDTLLRLAKALGVRPETLLEQIEKSA